ncbi:B2 bradykinin receptor-like [Archocentrus centrarchus]|uniref:B2 bradykinin receptor-like n=1 Tax=Archocentrus centrarchus TaxID=63155 RepID=UPI0011E9B75E|nr:B2 bradykinin receptor-like [Archocentrus centrarchus]
MSGNQSNTNESHCIIDDTSLIFTLVPAYILVISVLALIFNISVLMVFCFHKKACTVAEIYLSNLAGVGLLPVYSLPFWADYVTNKYSWPFAEVFCKLVPAVINMNAFCSIYFIVLVCIDHYLALVHPLALERMSRPLNAKLGCLVVWSLGLAFALPTFIYRKLRFEPWSNGTVSCDLDYTDNEFLMSEMRTIMFSFIIPISIIFFCTVRIIQAMNKRLPVGLNTWRTEQKTTTLILVVLLAFLICWVPFRVSRILVVLEHVGMLSCHIILILYQEVSAYLAFFNSVLNPILYIIFGKRFRKRAKEFFKH